MTNLNSKNFLGKHEFDYEQDDDYLPLPNIGESAKKQDEKKSAKKTPKR